MSEVNFGSDGDFSHEKMVRKVNTNLANELGNLCQRTLTMVYKYCDMTVPIQLQPLNEEDKAILYKAKALRITCGEAISTQAIHNYVAAMVSMIWDVNKYFDEMQPWVLRKTDPQRMETVLYILMEVLRCCAILYQPIIPSSANRILDLLGVPKEERMFDHINEASIRKGAKIVKPHAVFPRIATES
jgi:Methionyl-tRNA synthetase